MLSKHRVDNFGPPSTRFIDHAQIDATEPSGERVEELAEPSR